MFECLLKMAKISVLFLISIIQFTQQTQPVCTNFDLPSPRTTDLGNIAWEVQKLEAKNGISLLADYSDIPNSQEVINSDLSCYTEGMNEPEDARLTIEQLVKKYGYGFESYNNVKTEDGYFITAHRIPNIGGDVVILKQILFGSSIDWLMAGNDSLPFVLADLGYDVWLGNFRGNMYSITHESLKPDCAEFWDFSFDEFGNYDLPALIDFISCKTGRKKSTLIVHSVSSTAFFVMASLRPEYNDRVTAIVLSPMALSTNMRSPLLRLIAANDDMDRKFKSGLGPYEYRPSDLLTDSLRSVMCANNDISQVLCSDTTFLITGFNEKCLNLKKFYTMSQHYPAGGSTKTLVHYSQNVASGLFNRFDYPDVNVNIDKYETINPTEYPVENINAKVSFVVSNNDYLSNVTDVLKLKDRLPNVGDIVYVDDYSSIDYLWGKNVKKKVYDRIVALLANNN